MFQSLTRAKDNVVNSGRPQWFSEPDVPHRIPSIPFLFCCEFASLEVANCGGVGMNIGARVCQGEGMDGLPQLCGAEMVLSLQNSPFPSHYIRQKTLVALL